MLLIGIGFIIIGCALHIILNSVDFFLYFDPPSLMLVLAAFTGSQVITGSFMVLEDSFIYLFRGRVKKDKEVTQEDLRDFGICYDTSYKTFLAASIIGFLFGVILTMIHIHDRTAIGPGISTTIITVIYTLFASMIILLPIKTRFTNEILQYKRSDNVEGSLNIFSVGGFLGVIAFFYLLIDFARGDFKELIFFPDIIIFFTFLISTLFVSNSVKPFVDTFIFTWPDPAKNDRNSQVVLINVYDMLMKTSIGLGIMQFFMNAVVIMVTLKNFEMMYYKTAQIMMPVVYGLVFGILVFYPLKIKSKYILKITSEDSLGN